MYLLVYKIFQADHFQQRWRALRSTAITPAMLVL